MTAQVSNHAMTRPLVVLCLALTSCLQPPVEQPEPPCSAAVASSCNELATGPNAGVCDNSRCQCLAGFELGPTGKCRPVAMCPATPQQPGQSCTNPGLTCRYADANPLCGSRTVRCIGAAWLEVEHSDPQPGCRPDAGTCTGSMPTCVMGTPGGLCGDAALLASCVQGSWVCPASTIPSTQCACSGNRGPTCTCTATGWTCVDAGVDGGACPLDCTEGDAGVGGVCSSGTCVCNPGFSKNPATGRCVAAQTCGVDQVTASTPLRCPAALGERLTPAAGRCQLGFFPIRDFACGPPFQTADGGYSCSNCRPFTIDLPDAGPINDQRCVEECTCTNRCTTGRCQAFPIFWGDDTPTSTVRLCL
jgi:hypothetical protein